MASKISKEEFLKACGRFYDDEQTRREDIAQSIAFVEARPESENIQEFVSLDDIEDRVALCRKIESKMRGMYHDNSIRLSTPVYSALLSKPLAELEQFVQFVAPLISSSVHAQQAGDALRYCKYLA